METPIDKAVTGHEIRSPSIYVIIPNKNGLAHLSYSLESLERSTYLNYRAILVDDHSTDDSVNFVGVHYPCTTVLTNDRKKGFAGAVNTGIAHALEHGAEYIAIFNSDIEVTPNWMELAIDLFDARPHAGLVGFTEMPIETGEKLYDKKDFKNIITYNKVKSVNGCLYVCPARVFQNVGFFDEDYYMYGEDNDFFCRVTRSGYSIIETNVPVWHYGEGSSGNHKLSNTWLTYRNALRYAIKNETLWGILRVFFSLLNQGCNGFLKEKGNISNSKRIRRYNGGINFMLVIASCCWNVFYLYRTLSQRQATYQALKNINAH